MKRLFLLAFAAIVALPLQANAAEKVLKITNRRDVFPILFIYITPAGHATWGKDQLGVKYSSPAKHVRGRSPGTVVMSMCRPRPSPVLLPKDGTSMSAEELNGRSTTRGRHSSLSQTNHRP